jgi:hypothetical protein
MRAIQHDLRHAARGLARSPGFAALAVLTLALGVGAHAAIFGWVDATFLRPLPVPRPDRLVGIYETRDGAGFHPLSLPDFGDYRERVRSLSGLAAHYPVASLILGAAAEAAGGAQEEILGAVVSPEYFPVLGLEPARGRFFRPEEGGAPGAHPSGEPTVRGLVVELLLGVHPALRPQSLRLAGLLLAAVTLVLLVAAANLGGLLLARNLGRRRESATRLAIGAGRWQVVRESVVEALVLAAAGGVASLLVAAWISRVLGALSPGERPLDLGLGAAVLGYAGALAAGTALLVGLAAGLQASRPGLVAALKDEAALGGGRRPRALGGLVVVQVALSFVLLAAAGLLVRSLHEAGRMGSVDAERVATLRLRPRLVGYGPERARPFTREVVRRLAALPGVEAVTIGRVLPPWGGLDAAAGAPEVVEVGPRFFTTFGVALVRGRVFDEGDRAGAPPVAIVNRALGEARWPGRDPVGELLAIGGREAQVVGVVEDAAYRSLAQVSPPTLYTPYEQSPDLVGARVGVLTAGPAADLLGVLQREVRAVDPAAPVTEVETFATRLDRLLGPVRLAESGLATSAALASWWPARRAARVDPARVLRQS